MKREAEPNDARSEIVRKLAWCAVLKINQERFLYSETLILITPSISEKIVEIRRQISLGNSTPKKFKFVAQFAHHQ